MPGVITRCGEGIEKTCGDARIAAQLFGSVHDRVYRQIPSSGKAQSDPSERIVINFTTAQGDWEGQLARFASRSDLARAR
jgi:hypothetical protein